MDDKPMKLVGEGDTLFRTFRSLQARVEMRERELRQVKNDLEEAKKKFGAWMCPKDAKAGEAFSIWYGDSLITVTLHSRHPDVFFVEARQRGKSWDEAAYT